MMRAGARAAVAAMSLATVAAACTPAVHKDYTLYRQHMPASVLVLPPLNDSVDVDASYTYLSTITMPLAEAGYYVFPVAVIDQMLKDNGLPTPGEMHEISLAKVAEIIGADAVLYVHIHQWGQKYQVISSTTVVSADARLVDVGTGETLWTGQARAVEGSGGSNDLLSAIIVAAVEQVLDSATDRTHDLSRTANATMVLDTKDGLLAGPRSPKYQTDPRGR